MSSSKHPSIRSKKSVKDYAMLIDQKATQYDVLINCYGQKVVFYEDPIYGDDFPVWVAFPDFEVAFLSSFMDIDDMNEVTGDYTPVFISQTGEFKLFYEIEEILPDMNCVITKINPRGDIRFVYTPIKAN